MNSITVLEIHSPDLTTFRLVGSLHSEMIQRDLTGTQINQITPSADQKLRNERLWNMASTPCGAVVVLTYARPSGSKLAGRRLALPVKPPNPSEPMRLFCALDRDGESLPNVVEPIDLVAVSDQFDYVDIGSGVP